MYAEVTLIVTIMKSKWRSKNGSSDTQEGTKKKTEK
jgi:hypothetical protein